MTSKWGFVSKQLAAVDAADEVRGATVAVLKLISEMELTDDERCQVLEYAQKLNVAEALIGDTPDEKWTDVVPGEYSIGDTVRVKRDAYVGDHGLRHNGKRGRIVGVQQSKTVVLYDDAENSEQSFYHEPYNLEKLVT